MSVLEQLLLGALTLLRPQNILDVSGVDAHIPAILRNFPDTKVTTTYGFCGLDGVEVMSSAAYRWHFDTLIAYRPLFGRDGLSTRNKCLETIVSADADYYIVASQDEEIKRGYLHSLMKERGLMLVADACVGTRWLHVYQKEGRPPLGAIHIVHDDIVKGQLSVTA